MLQPTPESIAQALEESRQLVAAEGIAVLQVRELVGNDQFNSFLTALLEGHGKVITSATGTSGTIARRLAHLLSVCGTPALFLHPTEGLHGSLGAVAAGDTVIALSKGGGTGELTEFVTRSKVRGARILVMTSHESSPLVEAADDVAVIPAGEGDPGNAIAMGSTLAMAAWGDALSLALMQLRGYSWEDFLFTHPGGRVGQDAGELLSRLKS